MKNIWKSEVKKRIKQEKNCFSNNYLHTYLPIDSPRLLPGDKFTSKWKPKAALSKINLVRMNLFSIMHNPSKLISLKCHRICHVTQQVKKTYQIAAFHFPLLEWMLDLRTQNRPSWSRRNFTSFVLGMTRTANISGFNTNGRNWLLKAGLPAYSLVTTFLLAERKILWKKMSV